MSRVGWYQLPNGGGVFHGPIPPGAVEYTPPVDDTVTILVVPETGASKAVWVEFAESIGVDATGTKAEVVARVEQHVDAVNSRNNVVTTVAVFDENPAQDAEFPVADTPVDPADSNSDAFGHQD